MRSKFARLWLSICRTWAKHRRALIAVATLIVVAIALLIALPWIRIYTGSAPPEQFYRAIATVPTPGEQRATVGIAHNAGNNRATTATALKYGAEVIEIDVTEAHGTLVAGRAHGFRWLAERVFRGPSLAEAWRYAAPARTIKLDLQRNDGQVLSALVRFLRTRDTTRAVMVSTRDVSAIEYLRPRLAPSVTLLFSVPFPEAETRIRNDSALRHAVGGLTVFRGLVTANFVTWAHQHRLLVLAWTVNDGADVARLLGDQVDGITTANLAILRALSG